MRLLLDDQQPLSSFGLRVVVLAAQSNRLADLILLVPRLLDVCAGAEEGEVAVVSWGEG